MTITLFVPCFMDALYPQAGISMVQILEKLGHTIEFPAELPSKSLQTPRTDGVIQELSQSYPFGFCR